MGSKRRKQNRKVRSALQAEGSSFVNRFWSKWKSWTLAGRLFSGTAIGILGVALSSVAWYAPDLWKPTLVLLPAQRFPLSDDRGVKGTEISVGNPSDKTVYDIWIEINLFNAPASYDNGALGGMPAAFRNARRYTWIKPSLFVPPPNPSSEPNTNNPVPPGFSLAVLQVFENPKKEQTLCIRIDRVLPHQILSGMLFPRWAIQGTAE